MKKLADLKLDENTIVIFSSDNGGVGGYREAGINTNEGITSNFPLRGGKGMLYEGGVRVPWIMKWTGRIRPGSTSDEPIISVDLFPTFCGLAKAKMPAKQILDGLDIAPIYLGDGSAKLERKAIYWHFPGYLGSGKNEWRTTPAGAIRAGDWKLQESFEDGKLELHNLKDDIGQTKNLAAEQPARRDELHRMLRDWRESVGAPMPAKR